MPTGITEFLIHEIDLQVWLTTTLKKQAKYRFYLQIELKLKGTLRTFICPLPSHQQPKFQHH